jgi:hypothetical protein
LNIHVAERFDFFLKLSGFMVGFFDELKQDDSGRTAGF